MAPPSGHLNLKSWPTLPSTSLAELLQLISLVGSKKGILILGDSGFDCFDCEVDCLLPKLLKSKEFEQT